MTSVYDDDNFHGRVNLAASYISAGRQSTRTFDSCFEMYDGAAVAQALYRRTIKNPNTRLAQNIWRYLARETIEEEALEYASERDLADLAFRLRARHKSVDAGQLFKTELTPAGEQVVIPGCERNAAPTMTQLDLFG